MCGRAEVREAVLPAVKSLWRTLNKIKFKKKKEKKIP